MSVESKQRVFSQAEFDDRIVRTRGFMREKSIDVLWVDEPEFLTYLTGFSISENLYRACLVPLKGSPVMVLRAMDTGPFIQTSWLTERVTFADWEDPLAVAAATAERYGWSGARIGIDENSYCMPLKRFKRLRSLLPQAVFVDFSETLGLLRMHKSSEEIAYLRQASKAADMAVEAIVSELHEGSTTRDADDIAHRVFMAQGADSTRTGIFTVGVGDNFLHGGFLSRPLQKFDVMHMELVPVVSGYSARMMRPVIFGGANEAQKRVARELIAIQDKQFEAMKLGVLASDVDAVARDGILASGLRADYLNITGYTLGFYPPFTPHTSDFSRVFQPTSQWRLEPGMVFHMYLAAAGLAFSETVLTTPDGIERLTRAPRQFYEIH